MLSNTQKKIIFRMISTPATTFTECSTLQLLKQKNSKPHFPFSPKTLKQLKKMRKNIPLYIQKKRSNSQHEHIPIHIHRNTHIPFEKYNPLSLSPKQYYYFLILTNLSVQIKLVNKYFITL